MTTARSKRVDIIAFLTLLPAVLLPWPAAASEDSGVRTNCYRGPQVSNTGTILRIPRDWKLSEPFSARYAAVGSSGDAVTDLAIDLDAMRFLTAPLVQKDAIGGKLFLSPDLSTFAPELVRQPFAHGRSDLFIVQSQTPANQVTLRKFLEQSGYSIRAYLPQFAYLVSLDGTGLATLSARADVFWIGLFQPAFRYAADLDYIIEKDPAHELKFTIHLDAASFTSEESIEAEISLANLKTLLVAKAVDGTWLARAYGRALDARSLAALPGTLWVERFVDHQLHNDVARTSSNVTTGRGATAGPIMDVEDVWARGIRGEGQIASAADTGLSTGNLATLHWDYGQQGVGTNPMRVIKGYALGRATTWDDNQTTGGGHGTHTSGSIVGNGIRSGSTPSTNTFGSSHAGTAPKAQFVFQSIMNSIGDLALPADLNNLFQPPYTDGARVHSNSWGAPVAGQYTTDSSNTDRFSWNNKDMVITFSAGNSGVDTGADGIINTDSIGAPGTAKNCITVGATENYRPTARYEYPANTCTAATTWTWFNATNFPANPVASDHMANNANGMGAFSSRGPCDDGRFKPDVSAPGIFILSTRTDLNQTYEQWGICGVLAGEQPYYVNMGGTSMSNPLTAGTATLVRQYYVDGWHANNSKVTNSSAVPGDGFNPTSALVKATLINGAWDMAPGQYGTGSTKEIPPGWDTGRSLPNNAEGYGRVDLEHSLFPGSGWGDSSGRVLEVHDVTAGLTTGNSNSYTFNVGMNTNPLIVTLVWTDPWASAAAGTRLINNLNLVVTAPDGTTKYTPNKVDDTAATVDNLNNVEQVKVTTPAVGTWTIQVNGTSVPGNGTGGTNSQPYALVVSGVGCTPPGVPGSVSATPTSSNQITVSWVAGSPAGSTYKVYRSAGSCPGGTYTLVQSGITGTSWVDTAVSGGSAYSYKVSAVDAAGTCESAPSSCASATATGTCTAPPTFAGTTGVSATAGATCSLTVSWAAGTSSCGGTLTYSVYRSTSSGFTPSTSNRIAYNLTGVTSYADSAGISPGTSYYYVVRATDSVNGQEDTNTVQASGVPVGPLTNLTETFEAAGGFDLSGWTHQALTGAVDWVWSTARSQSPSHSWYSASQTTITDRVLVSPTINVAATSTLSFYHTYAFEGSTSTCYDGGTLEVSTNGGTSWSVVPDAAFTAGAFTGTVNSSFGNPIGGKRSWCAGALGTMTQVTVNLGGAYNGQSIKIRWHEGDDNSSVASGWFVDSVVFSNVSNGTCAAAPADVQYFAARATGASGGSTGQAKVEWINPSGSYTGVRVLRKANSAPTGWNDGAATLVPTGSCSFGSAGGHAWCTDTGLTLGTTYYYAAYVYSGTNYSSGKVVSARPQDTTSTTVPIRWAYSTGASNLAPPGIGAALMDVSNDRIVHSAAMGSSGGDWPSSWTPLAMNAPSQARPLIRQISIGGASRVAFIGSQDGYVYCVNADTGAQIWQSPALAGPVQGGPIGIFTAYGQGYDLIFVGTRSSTASNVLYALNASTGAIAWQFNNGGAGNGIGIISDSVSVDPAAGRVYFASRARVGGSSDTAWCLSYNGSSATKVWSTPVGDIDGAVTLVGTRLYVGTNTGNVYALSTADGAQQWSVTTLANGPVKGYLWPDRTVSPVALYASTSTKVWRIVDNGASAGLTWASGITLPASASPSAPVLWPGANSLFAGGSDGKLYQIDKTLGSGQTLKSVALGAGTSSGGAVAIDPGNGIAYIGTDGGVLYSVAVPLP